MNLFISYSSKSREAVDQLASDLTDLGYTVWFDRELTGGHQWWGAILAQIRDCDVFVFALTPESLDSYPCELEWKYAATLCKRILPVQLAEVRLNAVPMALQEIQMVDYQTRGMTQLAALNKAIVKLPAAQPLPDPLPPEPPTPLAPLVVLGEQLDTPTLSADAQLLLIAKLRPFLEDADTKPDAIALLKRLRRRDDLLARTAEEIGQLLNEPSRGRLRASPVIPTHTAIHTFTHEHDVYSALFVGDDEILAGCENGHVYRWNLHPVFVQTFVIGPESPSKKEDGIKLHNGAIRTMALAPDGKSLATGSDDQRVHLCQYPQLFVYPSVFMSHNRTVNSVAFSPDGSLIFAGADDGTMMVWSFDITTYPPKWPAKYLFKHGDKVRTVAVSSNATYALSAGTDGIIRVWAIGNGSELARLREHESWRKGETVSEQTEDEIIRSLWGLGDKSVVQQLRGHESSVNGAAFSPIGSHIVSGSSDWTVRLWDAANGKEIRQFLGHNGRVSSVAFAPDGKHIVSAAADKRAILWDVESGEEVCHFVGHTGRISSVAFSPDGQSIVTASHDKTARVWETGL